MDNRYTIIKDLVVQASRRLRDAGISIDEADIDRIVQDFNTKDVSISQIRSEIKGMERSRMIEREIQEMLVSSLDVARNLQSLSVQHKGITLHNQDIDLMMIATSNNFSELAEVMEKVTNISLPEGFEEGDFFEYRQRVFEAYQDSLSSRNDSILTPGINLVRKIEYLGQSGVVSSEEMFTINKIIAENKDSGVSAIMQAFRDNFEEDKVHEMLLTIRDFSPIEKEGIKSSTLDAYRMLYDQLKYSYDSITLDEEVKYGKVILQDGTYDDRHLRKSLEFAKSLGKTMRMNTLVFYMDCPKDIYEMDEGVEATKEAKEKLGFYISEVSKTLSEYCDVVRSVDVFNELLNRHPMVGEVFYMLRGDITQHEDMENFDNIDAGWLKHLSVEDICDVLVAARENLPQMDFMYNDDYLTDPEKIPATIELIKRIQDYSKGLGVTLIDSVGTQMHIDNDVSKEEIRQMFLSLGELGLPIEITEFDLAMTSGVDGLTSEQIEFIRQKKINEVYEVIEELKDKCNILGITIWSKTDSQNFRVSLANEELLEAGMEPVSSLHGGMFTEKMVPKSAEFSKKIRKGNFNYHTHTSRCGHASEAIDDEYVVAARNMGISVLGFTDHVPFSELEYWDSKGRMYISEVDEYIKSIGRLKEENPDMTILCGFEAEYSPMKKGFLGDLRDKCDYMILGQHYVTEGIRNVSCENNVNYPMQYAKMVCEAMETGMFDIVAHPDIFMQYRDSFSTDNEKAEFLENAKKASYMICEKAREIGVLLELNTAGLEKGLLSDGQYGYPHSLFWEIAGEVGNSVLFGVDAHDPSQIMDIDSDRKEIEGVIDTTSLKLVDDYNLVDERRNNTMIQQLYEDSRKSSVTYETALIGEIIAGSDVDMSEDVFHQLDTSVKKMKEKLEKEARLKKERALEKIDEVSAGEMSCSEKVASLAVLKLENERIGQTLKTRTEVFERAGEFLLEAQAMGCETKDEYQEVVGYLTEMKSQNDSGKVMTASNGLDNFSRKKESSKSSYDQSTESSKVYTYENSNSISSSNESGVVGSVNLLVLVLVLILVIFGIILGLVLHYWVRRNIL